MYNIIFLGAPGCGKGTQAEFVAKSFDIPIISTGNIIRQKAASCDEVGKKIKGCIESGNLLADDLVVGIVKDRLTCDDCKNGFILDGFPRTLGQAKALDDLGINIDKVIEVNVDDELVVNRISSRRVCLKCGATYSLIFKKPKIDNICDNCSSELIQRKDDSIDVVKERLKVYHRETEPLIEFYKARGKLLVIDGSKTIAEISNDIKDKLGVLE